MMVPRDAGALSRMATVERLLLIGQPFLLAAALVLARWSDDATPIQTLVRPMLAVAVLAAVSLGTMRLVTGSWPWAALISNALLLFTMREMLPALVLGSLLSHGCSLPCSPVSDVAPRRR